MEPEKKTNIIKLTIIALALIIDILILVFIAYPLYENISTLQQQINVKQQEEEALKQRIENLKELEKNYQVAKEKSKMVELALPNEKQIPEILIQLENIAGENGMTFSEITPGTAMKGTPGGGAKTPTVSPSSSASGLYQEIPLTVKIAGSFSGLKNYLKSIEKNVRIFDINAISIEKATEGKVLNISLAITAYFQPKK